MIFKKSWDLQVNKWWNWQTLRFKQKKTRDAVQTIHIPLEGVKCPRRRSEVQASAPVGGRWQCRSKLVWNAHRLQDQLLDTRLQGTLPGWSSGTGEGRRCLSWQCRAERAEGCSHIWGTKVQGPQQGPEGHTQWGQGISLLSLPPPPQNGIHNLGFQDPHGWPLDHGPWLFYTLLSTHHLPSRSPSAHHRASHLQALPRKPCVPSTRVYVRTPTSLLRGLHWPLDSKCVHNPFMSYSSVLFWVFLFFILSLVFHFPIFFFCLLTFQNSILIYLYFFEYISSYRFLVVALGIAFYICNLSVYQYQHFTTLSYFISLCLHYF